MKYKKLLNEKIKEIEEFKLTYPKLLKKVYRIGEELKPTKIIKGCATFNYLGAIIDNHFVDETYHFDVDWVDEPEI